MKILFTDLDGTLLNDEKQIPEENSIAVKRTLQNGNAVVLCKMCIRDRADIIPVFFIVFSVCLAHAGQFISHLLADIIRDFLYKSVILQRTSGYVQRQIRAVDDTL